MDNVAILPASAGYSISSLRKDRVIPVGAFDVVRTGVAGQRQPDGPHANQLFQPASQRVVHRGRHSVGSIQKNLLEAGNRRVARERAFADHGQRIVHDIEIVTQAAIHRCRSSSTDNGVVTRPAHKRVSSERVAAEVRFHLPVCVVERDAALVVFNISADLDDRAIGQHPKPCANLRTQHAIDSKGRVEFAVLRQANDQGSFPVLVHLRDSCHKELTTR